MGGFKRVAAALELAFLPARRGRSAAGAWSPGDVQSPLALVQFGSSQHPVSISQAPLPVGSGSPPPHHRDRHANGDEAGACRPEREGRAARLTAEQRVRSGEDASDSLGTEVSNEPPLRKTALRGRRSRLVLQTAPQGRGLGALAASSSGTCKEPRSGPAAPLPIPAGRPPFTIAMRGAAAGLGASLQLKQASYIPK